MEAVCLTHFGNKQSHIIVKAPVTKLHSQRLYINPHTLLFRFKKMN